MLHALQGENLATYLNDHLAGSTFGLDLARSATDHQKAGDSSAQLSRIADELSAEREVLKKSMKALDIQESAPKKAAGWVVEKMSHLKLSRTTNDPELVRLLELETLTTGVAGKRCLWQSLEVIRQNDARLAPFDYAALRELAESQLERIETLRRQTI